MCPHATHVSHSLSLHHTQTPFTMAAVDARNGKPWAVIECPHRCSTECPHQQPHMVGPLCSTARLPTCLRVALGARSIRIRRPAWAWHLGAALQGGQQRVTSGKGRRQQQVTSGKGRRQQRRQSPGGEEAAHGCSPAR